MKHHHPTTRRLWAGVATAILVIGAAGCGGAEPEPELVASPDLPAVAGDEPLERDDDVDGPDLGGAPIASLAEQCDAYVELGQAVAGSGDLDVVAVADHVAAVAPIDVRAQAETFAAAIRSAGEDPDALTARSTLEAVQQMGNFFFDMCELDEQVQVIAADDGVASFPASLPAGRVGIELANMTSGSEPVQLVLARRDDDDPRTEAQLAQLTPDQLAEDHDPVGVLWTEISDDTVAWLFDLEPGSYLAVSSSPGGDEVASVVIVEVGP